MAGTKEGARKTRAKYGRDFFKRAGKKGGNPVLLEQARKKKERDKLDPVVTTRNGKPVRMSELSPAERQITKLANKLHIVIDIRRNRDNELIGEPTKERA